MKRAHEIKLRKKFKEESNCNIYTGNPTNPTEVKGIPVVTEDKFIEILEQLEEEGLKLPDWCEHKRTDFAPGVFGGTYCLDCNEKV